MADKNLDEQMMRDPNLKIAVARVKPGQKPTFSKADAEMMRRRALKQLAEREKQDGKPR